MASHSFGSRMTSAQMRLQAMLQQRDLREELSRVYYQLMGQGDWYALHEQNALQLHQKLRQLRDRVLAFTSPPTEERRSVIGETHDGNANEEEVVVVPDASPLLTHIRETPHTFSSADNCFRQNVSPTLNVAPDPGSMNLGDENVGEGPVSALASPSTPRALPKGSTFALSHERDADRPPVRLRGAPAAEMRAVHTTFDSMAKSQVTSRASVTASYPPCVCPGASRPFIGYTDHVPSYLQSLTCDQVRSYYMSVCGEDAVRLPSRVDDEEEKAMAVDSVVDVGAALFALLFPLLQGLHSVLTAPPTLEMQFASDAEGITPAPLLAHTSVADLSRMYWCRHLRQLLHETITGLLCFTSFVEGSTTHAEHLERQSLQACAVHAGSRRPHEFAGECTSRLFAGALSRSGVIVPDCESIAVSFMQEHLFNALMSMLNSPDYDGMFIGDLFVCDVTDDRDAAGMQRVSPRVIMPNSEDRLTVEHDFIDIQCICRHGACRGL